MVIDLAEIVLHATEVLSFRIKALSFESLESFSQVFLDAGADVLHVAQETHNLSVACNTFPSCRLKPGRPRIGT
jgi:hypothetical protein